MSIFSHEDTAWSAWTKAMESIIGDPGAPLIVQTPTILTPFDVRTSVNPRLARYRKHLLGDSIPFYGNKNPPVATGGISKTVSAGYEQYLGELNRVAEKKYVNPNDRKVIKRARKGYEEAQKDLRDYLRKARKNWRKEKADNPALTREEWEVDYGYRPSLNLMQGDARRAYGRYSALSRPYPQLTRIQKALARMDYGVGTQVRLPTTEDDLAFGEDSWEEFYKTNLEIGESWDNFWNSDAPMEAKIEERSSQSSYYNHSWSVGGSVRWGFFRAGGSSSGGTVSTRFRSDTQSVKFEFDKLVEGKVVRGSWYDPGLVAGLPYHAWVKQAHYWGPKGTLNLIPVSAVIGRGVKVTISTSKAAVDTYKSWRQNSGSAGFGIGGFSIGGSGASSTSWGSVSESFTDTSITIEDQSGQAYLMATVLSKMDEVVEKSQFDTELARLEYASIADEEERWAMENPALDEALLTKVAGKSKAA